MLIRYSKILPKIIGKNFNEYEFKPRKIYDSLLKETSISKEIAKRITDKVCRFLIVNNLQLITKPLIREIVNVELLKLGFEKERLQNTRIGFPYYDLVQLTNETNSLLFLKTLNLKENIFKHILKEYNDVKKLIEDNI